METERGKHHDLHSGTTCGSGSSGCAGEDTRRDVSAVDQSAVQKYRCNLIHSSDKDVQERERLEGEFGCRSNSQLGGDEACGEGSDSEE
jgi:hypothetical protein